MEGVIGGGGGGGGEDDDGGVGERRGEVVIVVVDCFFVMKLMDLKDEQVRIVLFNSVLLIC